MSKENEYVMHNKAWYEQKYKEYDDELNRLKDAFQGYPGVRSWMSVSSDEKVMTVQTRMFNEYLEAYTEVYGAELANNMLQSVTGNQKKAAQNGIKVIKEDLGKLLKSKKASVTGIFADAYKAFKDGFTKITKFLRSSNKQKWNLIKTQFVLALDKATREAKKLSLKIKKYARQIQCGIDYAAKILLIAPEKAFAKLKAIPANKKIGRKMARKNNLKNL